MRRPRAFWWAVAASLALHAGLVVVAVVVARSQVTHQPTDTPIDTRADEPPITFATVVERSVPVSMPEPPSTPAPTPEPVPAGPPVVQVPNIPSTLPPELLPLLKKPPTPTPVGPAVVEVPLTATSLKPTPAREPAPEVRPVGGASTPSVPPVHGALRPGQTIVYVLDASGSMGEWEKFASARRALIATLRAQPESVRVQVVVYSSTARTAVPGACVPATPANVERIEQSLANAEPAGRSDHVAGLRAALELRPDFVLIVTDADDLNAGKFRGLLARSAKPAAVCVAKVTAAGVSTPSELK